MSMKNCCEIPPNKEKKLRQVLVSSCFMFIFIFASYFSFSDEVKKRRVCTLKSNILPLRTITNLRFVSSQVDGIERVKEKEE